MTHRLREMNPGRRVFEDREYLDLKADLITLNTLFEAGRVGTAGAEWAVASEEARNLRLQVLTKERSKGPKVEA